MLNKRKNKSLLIYIAIIVLQVLAVVYWANCKTNYHVDELYSMGYAGGLTNQVYVSQYITTSHDFHFNKWIKNADLKQYLIVSGKERFFEQPFPSFEKRLISGRNYFCLLNVAESIAGIPYISAVPGVALNIVFFVLAEIFLVLLLKEIHVSERFRLLALTMFGFSGYMISSVNYIRFYMFIIMMMIMILFCLCRIWNAITWSQILVPEVSIVLLAYFSFRNSELMAPFFGAIMGSFLVALIVTKRKRQLVACLLLCLGGAGFIAVTTNFIGILLRPQDYSTFQGVWLRASTDIHDASLESITSYMGWLLRLYESLFFSNASVLFLFAGALTVIVLKKANIRMGEDYVDINRLRPVTLIAFIVWLGIFGITVVTGRGRAVSLAVLAVVAFMAFLEIAGIKIKISELRFSSDTQFVFVIASETVIYTSFCALCYYDTWRYYCYGFVSAFIVFWYVIDRFAEIRDLQCIKRILIGVLTAFVVLNSILPFKTRAIECIYEDEKPFIEELKSNENLDVVMVLPADEKSILSEEQTYLCRHAIYDFVHLMPDETRVYFAKLAEYDHENMVYPAKFLLWTQEYQENIDLAPVIRDLRHDGYNVTEMGSDHDSMVYIVSESTLYE